MDFKVCGVRSCLLPGPLTTISSLAVPANGLYGLVFCFSGVHDMGRRFAEGAPLSIPDTVARDTYIARQNEIEVAMVGTQLMGIVLRARLWMMAYVVVGLLQRLDETQSHWIAYLLEVVIHRILNILARQLAGDDLLDFQTEPLFWTRLRSVAK
jgi:hypothetical protein